MTSPTTLDIGEPMPENTAHPVLTPEPVTGLTRVELYALDMVTEGAENTSKNDLNEDGELSDVEHEAARALAAWVIEGMRANPFVLLELAATVADDVDG